MKFTIALLVAALLATTDVAAASATTLRTAIRSVFGSRSAQATCISRHEAGLDARAVSPPNYDGSRDYGAFQINSTHFGKTLRSRVGRIYVSRRKILDAAYNTRVAYVLSDGGRDWNPWSVYSVLGFCRS